MPSPSGSSGGWWDSPVLRHLVDGRRRRVLAVLVDRSSPVDERDLATHVVASERDKELIEVTEEERRSALVGLEHSHLPALAGADLVVWDRSAATATTTDHPALLDPRLRYVIEQQTDAWDDVLASLLDERRQNTLSVVEAHDDYDEPLARETLAREVAVRENGAHPSEAEVERTLHTLHHVHLPKLEAAGLLEYDVDDGTVAARRHPDLDETWFDVPLHETSRTGLEWLSQSS